MTHSPLPWTRGHETSDGFYIHSGTNLILRTIASVDDLEERENAKFAVHAANCHYDLLAALREVANYFEGEDLERYPVYATVLNAIAKATGA